MHPAAGPKKYPGGHREKGRDVMGYDGYEWFFAFEIYGRIFVGDSDRKTWGNPELNQPIMEVSIVMGYPQLAGWFFGERENPIYKWMITRETPILGNTH